MSMGRIFDMFGIPANIYLYFFPHIIESKNMCSFTVTSHLIDCMISAAIVQGAKCKTQDMSIKCVYNVF